MQISASGKTDVGCVRENNEDALLVRADLPLFVVADGVGGAAAGEIASKLFVTSCEYEFETYTRKQADGEMLITRCFQNANRKILDHVQQFPETKGMACTAELLTFISSHYYIGHVGDSRTYLVREGRIKRLTKDHSYVQEQMDLGLLAPEDAKEHWLKNAIYRAIGVDEDLSVDIYHGRVKSGDIFLLCSDGLSDLATEEELTGIITAAASLEESVQRLIDHAKSNGGKDNITAVLCQVEKVSMFQTISSLFKVTE
jgi:serine/threonine protein phosphatase PrpC